MMQSRKSGQKPQFVHFLMISRSNMSKLQTFREKQVSFKLKVIFSANSGQNLLQAKNLLEPLLRKTSKCLVLG